MVCIYDHTFLVSVWTLALFISNILQVVRYRLLLFPRFLCSVFCLCRTSTLILFISFITWFSRLTFGLHLALIPFVFQFVIFLIVALSSLLLLICPYQRILCSFIIFTISSSYSISFVSKFIRLRCSSSVIFHTL